MSKFYYNEEQESYDAIVVGTGISGGWAAKELCENGLKTLVLERGRMVTHRKDYKTANLDPWDFPNAGQPTTEMIAKQEKQHRTGYTTNAASHMWFVNDLEHPYNETRRFDWMRGYHVGGRSLQWGRHSYRWSDIDFKANSEDGHGVDWPVRYKDIAPWYDKVESYIGVTGEKLGLEQLPDGQFEPALELNCVENHVREKISENFDGRVMTSGRIAHINSDKQFDGDGRSRCQFRNRCIRGCPFGAYFSSLSSTLPAAEATGNMTLRVDSIVHEVMYDSDTKKAIGVKVIDRLTKETYEFKAKVIFLCASAVASTSILMQSKSDRFPNGMGNDSDQLGRNIMDHQLGVGASGKFDGFGDKYYKGRRPNGIYIPRYWNIDEKSKSDKFVRGFGFQGGGYRGGNAANSESFGPDFKKEIMKPGPWEFFITGFAECLPYHDNQITLNHDVLDKWGQPTLSIDAEFKANEKALNKQIQIDAVEMLEKAGVKDVMGFDNEHPPGFGVHEMGTARMGKNPKTSVLNKFNQVHAAKNVFVTDGACMTSSSCVNPSLTYMAITARAADHAVAELNKRNI